MHKNSLSIKGQGSIKRKPDTTLLSLRIDTQDKEYGKAITLANTSIEQVKQAILSVGFKAEDLKTTNFNVQTDYDNIQEKNGQYKQILKGYICHHYLELSFDFDNERLATILEKLSHTSVNPDIDIAFLLKADPKLRNTLIEEAFEDAYQKAKILAKVSNVSLGNILHIEYENFENYHVSQSSMKVMSLNASFDITPQDISLSESVHVEWEIKAND